MPRFLVVHTMPLTEEEWVEAVKALAAQLPEGITYELTYCNFPAASSFAIGRVPARRCSERFFTLQRFPSMRFVLCGCLMLLKARWSRAEGLVGRTREGAAVSVDSPHRNLPRCPFAARLAETRSVSAETTRAGTLHTRA